MGVRGWLLYGPDHYDDHHEYFARFSKDLRGVVRGFQTIKPPNVEDEELRSFLASRQSGPDAVAKTVGLEPRFKSDKAKREYHLIILNRQAIEAEIPLKELPCLAFRDPSTTQPPSFLRLQDQWLDPPEVRDAAFAEIFAWFEAKPIPWNPPSTLLNEDWPSGDLNRKMDSYLRDLRATIQRIIRYAQVDDPLVVNLRQTRLELAKATVLDWESSWTYMKGQLDQAVRPLVEDFFPARMSQYIKLSSPPSIVELNTPRVTDPDQEMVISDEEGVLRRPHPDYLLANEEYNRQIVIKKKQEILHFIEELCVHRISALRDNSGEFSPRSGNELPKIQANKFLPIFEDGHSAFLPGLNWAVPECRQVHWKGVKYKLSPTEAAIVHAMIQVSLKGPVDIGSGWLLEEAGSSARRIRDVMKRSGLWRTLIIKGDKKDTLRLNID